MQNSALKKSFCSEIPEVSCAHSFQAPSLSHLQQRTAGACMQEDRFCQGKLFL